MYAADVQLQGPTTTWSCLSGRVLGQVRIYVCCFISVLAKMKRYNFQFNHRDISFRLKYCSRRNVDLNHEILILFIAQAAPFKNVRAKGSAWLEDWYLYSFYFLKGLFMKKQIFQSRFHLVWGYLIYRSYVKFRHI